MQLLVESEKYASVQVSGAGLDRVTARARGAVRLAAPSLVYPATWSSGPVAPSSKHFTYVSPHFVSLGLPLSAIRTPI